MCKSQMQYNLKEIVVKPGSRVKITLSNGDDLPHNLVVCHPGKTKGADRGIELSEAVLKLGDKCWKWSLSQKIIPA